MIFGDYHIHSFHSKDATGSIDAIVQSAIKKGLSEIGLTEHGFLHADGISRAELIRIKREIHEARKKYGDRIKIYFGIEANLINHKGDIDLTREEQDQFDYIILGFHKRVRGIKNLIPHIKMFGKKHIEKNTMAYITAIQKNKIKILAHLNYATNVDVKKLSRVARENNVLIELNGKRVLFSAEEIKELINEKVDFIINSDSHSPEEVGRTFRGENIVEKYCIPISRVVNSDRTTIHGEMQTKSLGHIFKYSDLEEG